MPINWDANMDRKLFMAILKIHNLSVDTTAVAKELSTDDQPCTAMAVQKRLQKIKSMIKDSIEGEGDDAGTPKSKGSATPRKRGRPIGNGNGDDSPSNQRKAAKGMSAKVKTPMAQEQEKDDEEPKGKASIKSEDMEDGEIA